jgi:hypothetical protein
MSGEKQTPDHPSAAQIKSRRLLLIALSLIFALWVAMMLVMYFSTVYPQRHPATSPTSSLTVVPG